MPPYSYYDIYRSTQDADIILDAGEREAQELEGLLREKLSYLQGSKKNLWEVRLLREARGDGVKKKDPLIGSQDFRNQNTDSYSTALVEITSPKEGESRIRDAFDWTNQKDSRFLIDLLEGKLTFHRNPLHAGTSRALSGYNPEIVSVIRALTKSFQYDAEIRPESLEEMKLIVKEFDPQGNFGPEAIHYILGNSRKIYQHSRDVENSRNVLDKIGFREKLITFSKFYKDEELERLLRREPLRSHPVGRAPWIEGVGSEYFGKTAKELGITTVAHDTRDFLSYENITMSRHGKPNLFSSRTEEKTENAIFGSGSYMSNGEQGAKKTKLTIRYSVDPDAICGRDFFLAKGKEYVVFRNAKALTTINEDKLPITLTEFVDLLETGRFSDGDLGVMKKFELKLLGEVNKSSDLEIHTVFEKALKSLRTSKYGTSASFSFVLSLLKSEPRLKTELIQSIFSKKFSPRQRFSIIHKYHLIDWMSEDSIMKGFSEELLEALAEGVSEFDSMREVNSFEYLLKEVSPKNTKKFGPILENALSRLDWERKNFASLSRTLIEIGYGKQVAGILTKSLDRIPLKNWDRSTWAIEERWEAFSANVNEKLFTPLNDYFEKLGSIPDEYRKWALDKRNPQYAHVEKMKLGLAPTFFQKCLFLFRRQ